MCLSTLGNSNKILTAVGIVKKEHYKLIFEELLHFLKTHPCAKQNDVHRHLEKIYGSISLSVSNALLKKLGWSWRVPTRFQTHKYTVRNLYYYSQYIQVLTAIPLTKLKFADESHIVWKDLGSKRVLGLKGKRTWTRESTLNQPSASLTLLTSLANGPNDPLFFVDYRIESNTQWDFVDFVRAACCNGYLVNGDFLVIDNAAVHGGMDSLPTLMDILTCFGVTLLKLPTYSPELNPCEIVFAHMKKYIRNQPNNNCSMGMVLCSLANISRGNLLNYYLKCVCPNVLLPEIF